VLQFIGGPVLIASAVAIGVAAMFSDAGNVVATTFVAIALLGCGVLEVVCGVGLWKLKRYGRTIQLALSWVGLLGFPAGTFISIVILAYLYRPGVKLLFSERAAGQFTAEEAAEIAAVSRGSLGSIIAVAGIAIIVIAATGIAAALAMPGLLRARMSGNEAAAIGALRTINLAQGRYAERCRGYASDLSGLRRTGQLVSSEWLGDATITQNGYQLSVEPEGTAIVVRDAPAGCDGTVSKQVRRARRPGDRRHDGHAILRDRCRGRDLPEHRCVDRESDSGNRDTRPVAERLQPSQIRQAGHRGEVARVDLQHRSRAVESIRGPAH
jgi:type II secretory pathway pseudopilin PulG